MADAVTNRRLYKQSVSFKAAIFREIVSSLSVPISIQANGESTPVGIGPALDQVLRWVLLIEGTSRIGISRSLSDKKRAVISLQNFVAGGTRSRLRITKKFRADADGKNSDGVTEPFEKLQAERGLETIRKLIESYFIDDLCRIFESRPSGYLYQRSVQLEEEMKIGREYIRTLCEISRGTTFFKHTSPLPVFGLVVYLTGILCNAYQDPGQLDRVATFDPWDSRIIHNFMAEFCENACLPPDNINTVGVYKNCSDAIMWEDMKHVDPFDVCLLRASLSASIVSTIVSLLPFIEKSSGRNPISAFRRTANAVRQGGNLYSEVQVLKKQIESGKWEHPFHVAIEDRSAIRDLGDAVHYLTLTLKPELLPAFGIVPRSQFGRLRVKNLEEKCTRMMSSRLKDTVSQIEKDTRRLGDFSKSCYNFADGGSTYRGAGDKNYRSFTLSGIDDLMDFFEKALKFAIQLFEEKSEVVKRGNVPDFAEFRAEAIRILTVGSLASDLSGTLTTLYEDYISKEILCGFEESSGARAPRTSKNSGRRDRSPKGNDGRTKNARVKRAGSGHASQ